MNMTENSQASMNCTHNTIEDVESEDHHVSQSSILYLLQEATKLALPAKALDYAESYESYSAEVPNKNPEPRDSPPGSLCPSQFPDGKSGEAALKPSFLGSFSLVHARVDSSPWEVMSLINQQCEKLLHSRQADGVEEDFTALSTNYPSERLPMCPGNNRFHSEGSECKEKHGCPPVALLTVTDNRQHCSIISDRGRETGIFKEEVHIALRTKTAPEHTVQSTPNIDDEAADAPVNLSDHNYSFSVSTRCKLLNHRQEERMDSLCSEVEVVVSPCTASPPQSNQRPASCCQEDRKPLPRKSAESTPSPSSTTEPGLTLAEGEGAFKPSLGFALDCNNNIQPQGPSQTKSPTAHNHRGPGISSATLGISLHACLLAPDHKTVCEGESTETPKAEIQTQTQAQVQAQVQAAAAAPQPDEQRSRRPRKQAHPSRSVDPCDPNLEGVLFSMNPKLDDGTNQCRLLITSNYSKKLRKRASGGRRCSRALRLPKETCSSEEEEEESEPCNLSTASKTCASCCTRKTPLWRDAEDGTPLCNACGIRYKKYRVRCTNCWHIPRKDGKSRSQCFKCGDTLRLTSHHKRAGW